MLVQPDTLTQVENTGDRNWAMNILKRSRTWPALCTDTLGLTKATRQGVS